MAPFATRLDRLRATVERVRATSGARDLAAPTIVLGGGGPSMPRAAAWGHIVTLKLLRSNAGLAANTVAQGTLTAFTDSRLRLVRDARHCGTWRCTCTSTTSTSGRGWRDEVAEAAGRLGLTEGPTHAGSPHVLAGDAEAIAATIRERRPTEPPGIGYLSISGSHLEEFQTVLALVAGSAAPTA